MNSQDDQDKELRRREQELQERETAIRLRELESEINSKQPPLHQTVRHQHKARKPWYKKVVMAGKLFVLVVTTIAIVKLASWLAGILITTVLVWVAYKLFLDSGNN